MPPLRRYKLATILTCLVVAAAPPVGFKWFLDTHVVSSAERTLEDYAERIIARVDDMLGDGESLLTELYQAHGTNCGVRMRESIRQALTQSHTIEEIVATDQRSNSSCSSALLATRRTTLSEIDSTSGSHTILVTENADGQRALAIGFRPHDHQELVLHYVAKSAAVDMLPDPWRGNGRARVMLEDGTEFEDEPPATGLTDVHAEETVSAERSSARFPVTAEIAVAKAAVMQDYSQLRGYSLAVMALFAAVVMGVAVAVARRWNRLSEDITTGMRRGEFIPYYQPVVNLATGRIDGCEVLVRRKRSDGSVEVPASFIAQAEADGQIVEITRQLMRLATQDLGEHYARHRELTVAFNLCALHFRDDSLIEDVRAIFGGSPMRFGQLVFEMTERFPLADMVKAKMIIAKLQGLGAQVALDDAGTGHSGLAALHRLGMDVVKIDKIFVDSIDADTTSAPIVDTLVELATNLGMSVVAEGVETLDQVRYLKMRGVDTAQGYLFAPPLPASSYLQLLDAMMPGVQESSAAG